MSPMRRRGVFLTGTRAQQSRSSAPMHLDYQPNGALRQVPMAQLPRISVALSGPPTASVIKVSKESTNRAICTFPPGGETAHYQRRGPLEDSCRPTSGLLRDGEAATGADRNGYGIKSPVRSGLIFGMILSPLRRFSAYSRLYSRPIRRAM
jgi:hypothetical protein